MTIFATIVAGVAVFVLGQILLKLVIEPIQKMRKTIALVAFHLANDHSTIHNAEIVEKEQAKEVSKNLKNISAHLISHKQLIPFYSSLSKLFSLPNVENIEKAAQREG